MAAPTKHRSLTGTSLARSGLGEEDVSGTSVGSANGEPQKNDNHGEQIIRQVNIPDDAPNAEDVPLPPGDVSPTKPIPIPSPKGSPDDQRTKKEESPSPTAAPNAFRAADLPSGSGSNDYQEIPQDGTSPVENQQPTALQIKESSNEPKRSVNQEEEAAPNQKSRGCRYYLCCCCFFSCCSDTDDDERQPLSQTSGKKKSTTNNVQDEINYTSEGPATDDVRNSAYVRVSRQDTTTV